MKLAIAGVRKRLGRRWAVDGVSFVVEGSATRALLGANGAGKSTLLRVIAGILHPEGGDVRLDGKSLIADATLRRHVGYVPEAADPLPHLGVRELLALVAALRRAEPPAAVLLERLGVTPFLEQRVGTLSLGQRRRAFLAAALVGDPWLLLMDEPTNGLSVEGVAELAALLGEHRAAGGAVLVATHDAAFVEHLGADVVRMADGKVVSGG